MDIVSLADVQAAVDLANKKISGIKIPSSLGSFNSDVKAWDGIIAEGGQCKSGEGIRKKIKSKGSHVSTEIDGMVSFNPGEISINFSGYKKVKVGVTPRHGEQA